jgi:hypothetical protein
MVCIVIKVVDIIEELLQGRRGSHSALYGVSKSILEEYGQP